MGNIIYAREQEQVRQQALRERRRLEAILDQVKMELGSADIRENKVFIRAVELYLEAGIELHPTDQVRYDRLTKHRNWLETK